MKGIDILCASQASTAICMMDEDSSSSSSTIHLGRAIDRYNPIIRDTTRTPKSLHNQTPIFTPKSLQTKTNTNTNTHKAKAKAASKGSSSSSSSSKRNKNIDDLQKNKSISISISNSNSNSNSDDDDIQSQKRKSFSSIITSVVNNQKQSMSESRKGGWGCTKAGDFISPPGSTRYLLSDTNINKSFHPNQILNSGQVVKKEVSPVSLPLPPPDQVVVVLRVSLHCRGCEKKMRKHLSRMEGVTSFNIDFAAKKITVVGDVTPLSVLSSVSKVKNAQLLGPAIPSSNVSSDHSTIQNFNTLVV